MSKQRMVSTRFWDDSYIASLDPIEKLLFIYLLTNSLTNILGIYEIEIRRIAFDTGIDKDMILKIMERFERDAKVLFVSGYIVLINFLKHQNIENPKMKTGIERTYAELPERIKIAIADKLRGMDRVCIGYLYPITLNLTKLNLTKLNLKEGSEVINPEQNLQSFTISQPLFKIEECRAAAEYCGMRADEGEKFFHYYNAQGWRRGKSGLLISDLISAFRSWIGKANELGLNVSSGVETFDEKAARLAKENAV